MIPSYKENPMVVDKQTSLSLVQSFQRVRWEGDTSIREYHREEHFPKEVTKGRRQRVIFMKTLTAAYSNNYSKSTMA